MKTLISLSPLLIGVVVLWLLVIRPAQRRQRTVSSMQHALTVGDEVITSGGIFGVVAGADDERLQLRVADGVVIAVARGAIVGLALPPEDRAQGLASSATESDNTMSTEAPSGAGDPTSRNGQE